MKKKAYEKPTCRVYDLKDHTMLLCGSTTDTLPDSPDYGDWLGAPEFNWVDKADQFGGWDVE